MMNYKNKSDRTIGVVADIVNEDLEEEDCLICPNCGAYTPKQVALNIKKSLKDSLLFPTIACHLCSMEWNI